MHLPSEPPDGASPAHTCISDSWSLGDHPFLSFMAPNLWHFVMAALANEHRVLASPAPHPLRPESLYLPSPVDT